jgi:hypothetical protein
VVFLSFQVNFGIITKLRIAMTKTAFNKRTLFTRKLGLSLRKKPALFYIRNMVFMVLKLGLLGTYVRNTWVVLKCDVGGE